MKGSDKKIISTLSYVALIIIAILLVFEYILPLIGVQVYGTFFNILNTIKNVFILIVIGISAYNLVESGAKWIKILFWIAVGIIVVATVLMWI